MSQQLRQTPDLIRTRDAIFWLRVISSLAWLQSALIGTDAKLAPAFASGAGLVNRIDQTFVHTALTPGVAALLRNVVVPHAHFFAMSIGIADLAIGLSLLLGLFARIGGVLEMLRATANIAVAAGAGADTIGFNAMLFTAGAIVVATGAGRRFGIDGWLARSANRTLRRIA